MSSCWNCALPRHAYDCPKRAATCKTCGKVFEFSPHPSVNENSLREHEKIHLPKTMVSIQDIIFVLLRQKFK